MIVTFYSFKGGVGRSMALANVGEILADQGYDVILCDWDLEAPGLERYLIPADRDALAQWRLETQEGLLDLLREFKDTLASPAQERVPENGADDPAFARVGEMLVRRPSSRTVPVSEERRRQGSVRLITAGRRGGDHDQGYAEQVRRFDWDEFYRRWAGSAYFEFFRRDLVGDFPSRQRGAADILLIDSRTGVTEQGGVCTHHLADLVVTMSAANDLNLQGTKRMAAALSAPGLKDLRGGRALGVLPVASRIEQTSEKSELDDFRVKFRDLFQQQIVETTRDREFARRAEIPYMPFYSYHERVVAREPEDRRDPKLYAAYAALSSAIVSYGVRQSLLREPPQLKTFGTVAAAEGEAGNAAPWSHEDFTTRLNAAVDAFDTELSTALCEELIEHLETSSERYPVQEAQQILSILRRKRRFDLVQRVAGTLIKEGQTAPVIRRQHAQAMIDQGRLEDALSVLESLVSESRNDELENAEARGLVGRVNKELYLRGDRGQGKALERALASYYEVYRNDPERNLWHGVNTVALLIRARRDRRVVAGFAAPEGLAHEILSQVNHGSERDFWLQATAAEACLALNQVGAAEDRISRYVTAPDVDAFELAGTLRQLTEVWSLQDEPLAAGILNLLRAHLLDRGGVVDLERDDWDEEHSTEAGMARRKSEALHRSPVLSSYRDGLTILQAISANIADNGSATFASVLFYNQRKVVMASSTALGREAMAVGAYRGYPERFRAKERPLKPNPRDRGVLMSAFEHDLSKYVASALPGCAAPPDSGRVFLVTPRDLHRRSLQSRLMTRTADGRPAHAGYDDEIWPGSPLFNEEWRLIGIDPGRESSSQARGPREFVPIISTLSEGTEAGA